MNAPPSSSNPSPKGGVGAALLVAFVVGLSTGLSLGILATNRGAKLAPTGQPSRLVAKGKDGWNRYRFSEIGLTLDLPARLYAGQRSKPPSRSNRVQLTEFSEFRSKDLAGKLSIFVFNGTAVLGTEAYRDQCANAGRFGSTVSGYKMSKSKLLIDGEPVYTIDEEYISHGKPSICKSYFFGLGNSVGSLETWYWADDAKSETELNRITKSMIFR